MRILSAHGSVDRACQVARTRGWIRDAEHLLVLTGAGISTDSGIPAPTGREAIDWTANAPGRRRVWRALAHFLRAGRPNAGHHALADLERAGRLGALVTQNVDGLHLVAGNSRRRLIEYHGDRRVAMCLACGSRIPTHLVLDVVEAGNDDPRCVCGGILRPAVLSGTGEVDPEAHTRAISAARRTDLLLAVGTTLSRFPVAGLARLAAARGRLVIVNRSPTRLDGIADVVLRGSISEVLPQLVV
ncbi:Sir2 family NAD-dependent protein deacetylase [Nocardia sp. NPDC050712]|uniref:SIR2 family NAD-dependent protein deacylase n=1 Tax=Nocardia sp. NPDC050712 TaxID=3155518 RepID=UPI0033ED63FC